MIAANEVLQLLYKKGAIMKVLRKISKKGLSEVIKGGFDLFMINNALYQIDEYDMAGKNLSIVSLDKGIRVFISTNNRYKSLKDLDFEICKLDYIRNDIQYYYSQNQAINFMKRFDKRVTNYSKYDTK